MKILVCVTKTPDTTARISFIDGDTAFDANGVQFIMNPYDEWYALVRALEWKESIGAGSVTVINVGLADNDPVIRKALAIGADEAVRINVNPGSSMAVATQIASYARDKGFDAILTGKESIDYNGSEIGGMLAEMLDMPFVSYANHLEESGNTLTVSRDIEGGTEVVEVQTPAVISAAKGLAEQRIPNMRGIMMAKRKPLTIVDPVETVDLSVPVKYELPPAKTAVKLVDPENMDELVKLLHEEAKVI